MQNISQVKRMPVAFVGHGSPMNALLKESDPYVQSLRGFSSRINKPSAVLVISAHWQTEGTFVINSPWPKTIHDFYGFPEELFNINYPAPGSPECALKINDLVTSETVQFDNGSWGFDHGAWSILKHLYPDADVPVLQLSLDVRKTPEQHYSLASELKTLREMGVLILGSGNVVHNLRRISFSREAPPEPWALRFDGWVKTALEDRNDQLLINDLQSTEDGRLSVPTIEHYLPLLYILGASDRHESVKFIFEEIQNASISMRSFVVPGT